MVSCRGSCRVCVYRIYLFTVASGVVVLHRRAVLRRAVMASTSGAVVDMSSYRELVKQAKTTHKRFRRMPAYIWSLLGDEKIANLPSVDDRASCFLKALAARHIRGRTAAKIYNSVRNDIFPNTNVTLDKLYFDRHARHGMQQRAMSARDVKTFVAYLQQRRDTTSTVWPLLFAFHTGLRASELVRVTYDMLANMKAKAPIILLKRKYSDTWRPVYHEHLVALVAFLTEHLADPMTEAARNAVVGDTPIFPETTRTLLYHMQHEYTQCFKRRPPLGLGLHTFRYYIAANTRNTKDAALLLGHANERTTRRYIRADPDAIRAKIAHMNAHSHIMKAVAAADNA